MGPLSDSRKKRLYFVTACLVLVFLAVIFRAVEIQVVKRDLLVDKSKKTSERFFSLGSVRGEIFDRQGEKLASSLAFDSVYVDGNIFTDRGENFWKLYNALNMDYESLAKKLENMKSYAWIKRHVTPEEAELVRALKLDGVGLQKEYKREYPNGSLAAQFLGFVGHDGKGLEGLELALDDKLRVDSEGLKVRRDRLGRLIMDVPEQAISQPKGASVMLTLDRRIQHIAEKAITQAVTERNAKSGMVLVMRPKTGEIIASAVYPTFDPNNYKESPEELRRNRVLTDPYEPGSTFKVFTVAAALEEKAITPDTVIFCENGLYRVDGNTNIRDTSSYGDLTVSQIVKVSSNIGAAKIGERLGPVKLHNYLTRFSFGEKTGLSYPAGESAGRLRPPKEWHVVDAANIAFGQGLSVTALQMVMAISSLGNDGVLMRPNLVSRVVDEDGKLIEQRSPQIIRQVVSPLTAHQVMAMMRMAVMKGGTGTKADIPGYPVAGKTGTAQKVLPGAGRYSLNKYVASFVGLAPYQDPELCVMVVLDEPWPAYYGGDVAAPVFREIMSAALPILDIPPVLENTEPNWPVLEKNDSGVPGVMAKNHPRNYLRVKINKGDRGTTGPLPDYWSDEKRVEDLAFDQPEVRPADLIEPPNEESGEPGIMPNLAGLSMREVLDIMSAYAMEMEYQGTGLVVKQDPPSGVPVITGQMARVIFESN